MGREDSANMIIEILDGQGAVITKCQTTEPDRDTAGYGGESWREYVEPAAVTLGRNRKQKALEVRAEGRARIIAISPDLANEDVLAAVRLVIRDTDATLTPNSELDNARQVFAYMRTKVDEVKTMSQAQLDAYDPTTDINWP